MTSTPKTTSADDELEDLLKAAGVQSSGGRSLLDPYHELIAAGLRRRPPLSYDQLATVVSAKLAKDGVLDETGKQATVTRSGVYSFVQRRRRQAERREGDAQALGGGNVRVAPTEPAVGSAPAVLAETPGPAHGRPSARKSSSSLLPQSNSGSSALEKLADEAKSQTPGFPSGIGKLLK